MSVPQLLGGLDPTGGVPLLAAIAAYRSRPGIEDALLGQLPGEPLDASDFSALVRDARLQRMLGLLAAMIMDGELPVTTDQELELQEPLLAALCGDLVRERELVELVTLLDSEGVDHRVLKGPAVAHLDYADPALRSFADVDLLVRSAQWDDAMRVLCASGWRRAFQEPRPGFERRFVKSMVLTRPDGPTELDLHRTLALGPFGLSVDLEDLWQQPEQLVLGAARNLKALDVDLRFIHSCFHAMLGDLPPRLVPLRDVAELACSPRLRAERVVALARSWRAEAVIAAALQMAWRTLRLKPYPLVTDLEARLVVPARQRKALEGYLSPRRSYVGLTLSATRALRRPSDVANYLVALAFPAREFIDGRYASRSDRWRQAARSLANRRGRTR